MNQMKKTQQQDTENNSGTWVLNLISIVVPFILTILVTVICAVFLGDTVQNSWVFILPSGLGIIYCLLWILCRNNVIKRHSSLANLRVFTPPIILGLYILALFYYLINQELFNTATFEMKQVMWSFILLLVECIIFFGIFVVKFGFRPSAIDIAKCIDSNNSSVICNHHTKCLPAVEYGNEYEITPIKVFENISTVKYSDSFSTNVDKVITKDHWSEYYEKLISNQTDKILGKDKEICYPAIFSVCAFSTSEILMEIYRAALKSKPSQFKTCLNEYNSVVGRTWIEKPLIGDISADLVRSFCAVGKVIFNHFETSSKVHDVATKTIESGRDVYIKRLSSKPSEKSVRDAEIETINQKCEEIKKCLNIRIVRILLIENRNEIDKINESPILKAGLEVLTALSGPVNLYYAFKEDILQRLNDGKNPSEFLKFLPMTDYALVLTSNNNSHQSSENDKTQYPIGISWVFDYYQESRVLLTTGNSCNKIENHHAYRAFYDDWRDHWNESAFYRKIEY